MKRYLHKAMIAVTLMAVLLSLSACGGGNAATSTPAASAPAVREDYMVGEGISADMPAMDMAKPESAPTMGRGETGSTVYRDPNAKLIREGELNIQTTEFDQTVAQLEKLVLDMGGYFENASIRGGSYRDVNANRMGDYTIRVPADRYDEFMGQSGDLGYVTYRNESTRNIGEQYYDTEARLKTQKTKQERLLTLLEKAETMEDIISLENALSDVEYQIEQLSSTLNRYDSLVGFSTIYLGISEVRKVDEQTGVTNTLGQRMSRGLASSLDDLVQGAQNLLVWFSYNVFVMLIFAVGASGVVVWVVKRNKKKNSAAQKNDTNET